MSSPQENPPSQSGHPSGSSPTLNLSPSSRNDQPDSPAKQTALGSVPFSEGFWDKTPDATRARKVYLKILTLTTLLITITIYAVLSIYWGSEWMLTGTHNIDGVIVDYDQGTVGETVTQSLLAMSGPKTMISWRTVSTSELPKGELDIEHYVVAREKSWFVLAINQGATTNLLQAVASANSTYNGSLAITAYSNEARNENAYRLLILPMLQDEMGNITATFAQSFGTNVSTSSNLAQLVSGAPQILTRPIYYTVMNLRPFDVDVATAVDFVGLIYLLILAFIAAAGNYSARVAVSGLDRRLRLSSLVPLRLIVPIIVYFWLSVHYCLVSLAFQVPFSRKFHNGSGFVVFWMLAWFGMMALGLAVEALITISTAQFIPFFLVLWIIVNVSVSFYPVEMLPTVFRYGYAAPFYQVSRGVRTIVFNTRNQLGLNFGILAAWIVLSLVTITLFQSFKRWQALKEHRKEREASEKSV